MLKYVMKRAIFTIILVVAMVVGASAQQRGFNLIVVGDTQPQTEAQFAELEHTILPHIATIVEEYRATSELPTAILLTGDVVWDTMEFLPRVKSLFEGLGVEVYAVIGNHDHDRTVSADERRAEEPYEHTFGQRYYTFRMGDTHFVALDNIAFQSYEKYSLSVDGEQRRWLRRVVRDIPEGERVAVAMHAPAFNYNNNKKPYSYTRKLLRILDDHRVNFITGHRHRHAVAEYGDNVIEHNVAQVNGNLWFAPICSDGMPRSVFCIEERDGEWQWHYRVLGEPASKQIVVWQENMVDGNEEYIVAKVVGWDDSWSVEWIENGKPMGAMEQLSILDPDYMHYVENEAAYSDEIMARLRRSARPHSHYFRCRRTSSDDHITIVATDRFGRVFSETIE